MHIFFILTLVFLALPLVALDNTSELKQYAAKIVDALEHDDFQTAYTLYESYASHDQTTDLQRATCYMYMAECLEFMDDHQGACVLRKAVLMTLDHDYTTYDARKRINTYYQNIY